MLTMKQIKDSLQSKFEALNYNCRVNKFTLFSFSNSLAELSGQFEISSANAKRFEIKIYGRSEDDFNVSCREDTSKPFDRWFAAKRFTKKPSVIKDCMEWIASATSEHATLYELLHPEMPLPEPHDFADGTYITDNSGSVYPGMCECAVVRDIVAMIGRRVVHTVYSPRQLPFFLIRVHLRAAGYFEIATDGNKWHPLQRFNDEYRVFPDNRLVKKLSTMNENDRQLIHAACREYIRRNLSEPKE